MKNPFISVLIVNWNGKDETINAVKSLLKSTYTNFEIIIADNNSSDGSIKALSTFDKVKIFNTGGNLGFAPAANLAYRNSSKGDFVFICAHDSEIEPDCFEKLVKAAEKYPAYGIFSPVNYELSNKNKIQQFGFKIDFFGFPLNLKHKTSLQGVKDYDIMCLPGGSLFIRKKVINKIGLYDDEYFVFVDDADLNWRAQIAGFKLKLVKDAKFYHKAYSGLSINNKNLYTVLLKRYMSERHSLNAILKNFQLYSLIFILPLYLLTNILEASYFLSNGRYKFALIYPKAWYWNFKHFGNLIKKRKLNRITRKKSDFELYDKIYKGWAKLYIMKRESVPGMS